MPRTTSRVTPGLSRACLTQSMGARFSSLRRASVSDSDAHSSPNPSPPTAASEYNEHATMLTTPHISGISQRSLQESQLLNHQAADAISEDRDVVQPEGCEEDVQPQPEQHPETKKVDLLQKKAPSSSLGKSHSSASAPTKITATIAGGEARINPPQGSDSCTGGIRCNLSVPKSLEPAAFSYSSIKTEFRVWEFPGVLSNEECDMLIAQGAGKWQRSRVQVRSRSRA